MTLVLANPSCCGHPMVWSTWAGGWVCGYCPNRR